MTVPGIQMSIVESISPVQSAPIAEVISKADDDDATVQEVSDDDHSYACTIVRGGLRCDSE